MTGSPPPRLRTGRRERAVCMIVGAGIMAGLLVHPRGPVGGLAFVAVLGLALFLLLLP